MRISVALAYYDGGKYIKEQLESILPQLGEEDEVVLSVDRAEDGSLPYLKSVSENDSRVRLLPGPGRGVVRNFEQAILHCRGDVIYLADQDDVWTADKVETVQRYFEETSLQAVLHDAVLVDERGRSLGDTLFSRRSSRTGLVRNFVKNSYVGCCMAFRRELVPLICPIPERMYMHDYWIGTAAELAGGVELIRKPLLKYRRHGDNVTRMEHGSLREMLRKRINILLCLPVLALRRKRFSK